MPRSEDRRRRQFCPKGHDTHVVGRDKGYACKECKRLKDRGKYQRNYEKNFRDYKNRNLRSNYGLSIEQLNDLAQQQGDKCAICEKPSHDSAHRTLHVDHDHSSGQIRGLLCGACNSALGLFQDDPLILRVAAAYLSVGGFRAS